MHKYSLPVRYLLFILGVITMSGGIALTVQARLGTAPISTLPTVLSFTGCGTVGSLTIYMNILFMVIQMLVLRHHYQLIQLLQLPAALLFGLAIDAWLWVFDWVTPQHYLSQAFVLILGTVILSLGVWIEVSPQVLMVPGEGVVVAIAKTFQRKFGNIKIGFDSTLVVLAAVISLILFHELVGAREGTIFAAVAVGSLVKLWQSIYIRITKDTV